jgi:monofunctional biosynthetic peptidoglycan transglycosylase
MKHLSKFSLSLLLAAVWGVSTAAEENPPRVQAPGPEPVPALFVNFTGAADEPEWAAVNDGVMGGLSQGGPRIHGGILHFAGILSLENTGGFSSVRTRPGSYNLSTTKAMLLRVMGDGRTYQLRISTDARHRGSRISYGADFPTKAGEWLEVTVPFATLTPSHHGRQLDGPPLDLSKVEEIGLLIGDGRAGDFALAVEWMKAE